LTYASVWTSSGSGKTLEHGDEVVTPVALLARELDQFLEFRRQQSFVGLAGHPDASTPTHFHEALVAQHSKCAQDRVGIHPEFGRQVPRLRDLLARRGLALCDGAAYLGGDLLVKKSRVTAVERSESEVGLGILFGSVDKTHDANYTSFMMSLLQVPRETLDDRKRWDPTIELLFREAKRRERQRRIRRTFAALATVAITLAAFGFGVVSAGSSSTKPHATPSVVTGSSAKVLTCSGASVARPRSLVVTCADANTALQSTHWSSWSASGASGSTTFVMNLCTPYCAASPLSYFPHSSVTLSTPVTSSRGTYFSRLVVKYRQGSTVKTYTFTWSKGVTR